MCVPSKHTLDLSDAVDVRGRLVQGLACDSSSPTARVPAQGAEGIARARSASEAFLLRRLETLPETAGRFQLNVKLPIPFNTIGSMEVDFLCTEAALVIELDGAQHLSDPEAYRRDRQKDALLQEHGFFVLRFLAEDLAKELDAVLDAVLRTLARRQRALSVQSSHG